MTTRAGRIVGELLTSLGFHRLPFGEALGRLEEVIGRAGTMTITD